MEYKSCISVPLVPSSLGWSNSIYADDGIEFVPAVPFLPSDGNGKGAWQQGNLAADTDVKGWWAASGNSRQIDIPAYPLSMRLTERAKEEMSLDGGWCWLMPLLEKVIDPDRIAAQGHEYERAASLWRNNSALAKTKVSVHGMQGARLKPTRSPASNTLTLVQYAKKIYLKRSMRYIDASGSPDGKPLGSRHLGGTPSSSLAMDDGVEFIRSVAIKNPLFDEWTEQVASFGVEFHSDIHREPCLAVEWGLGLLANICSAPQSLEMGKPQIYLTQDRFNLYGFPENYLFKMNFEVVTYATEMKRSVGEMCWMWRNSPKREAGGES
jgi:hypothetical protein